MEIDPIAAKAALDDARMLNARMKHALKASGVAYHFIVWGAIWLAGFMISQFADSLPAVVSAWHWLVLSVIGNAFSLGFGLRMRKALKTIPQEGIKPIILLFLAFAFLGAFFARPAGAKEGAMLIVMVLMLWLGVMGALLNRALVPVALGIAALGAVSLWLFSDFFHLSMAIGGGGALIGTGLRFLARSGE